MLSIDSYMRIYHIMFTHVHTCIYMIQVTLYSCNIMHCPIYQNEEIKGSRGNPD
jgi:hypothetical protein